MHTPCLPASPCPRWFATSILSVLTTLRVATADPAPGESAGAGAPLALFNGHNLDGWYVVIQNQGPAAAQHIFSVTDGTIHTYADAADGSAQPFAGLLTKAEYSDYRLTLEYKWGVKKFAPRAQPDSVRDAGVCYHVQGPDVIWPSSLECQIEEGDTGDVWAIHTRATSTVHPDNLNYVIPGDGGVVVTRGNDPNGFQRFLRSYCYEVPGWNRVEVTVRGDCATYRINGHVANRVTALKRWDPPSESWQRLARGKILLQAEGSEVYYRQVVLARLAPSDPPKN